MLKPVLGAAGALFLFSCASDPAIQDDPAFLSGYGDGCATAHELEKSFSTKRVKDEHQFESDRAYRSGWRQGYQQCQTPYRKTDDGGRILGDEEGF